MHSIDAIGERLYERQFGSPQIASRDAIRKLISDAGDTTPNHKFTLGFMQAEWEELVDAWQLESWEAYRDVKRLGRKTRLPEAQRAVLWSIFRKVARRTQGGGLTTYAALFSQLANDLSTT